MKKLLIVALVVAIALVAVSCATSKTYYYAVEAAGIGVCATITTSDANVQKAAVASSYKEGSCPSGYSTKGCTYTQTGIGTITTHYKGYTDDASMESACKAMNGTWK